MSHSRHLIAALAASAALTGCGQATTEVARKTPATSPAQVTAPAAPAPSAGGAAARVLRFAQGAWLSDCRVLPFRSPFRTRLVFAGMELTHESSVYQDPQCHELLSTWSRQLTITLVHREESADSDGVELVLSVHANAVNLTTFNGYGPVAGSVCGLPSWVDGTPRDVSGRQCGPGRLEAKGRESTITLLHDPGFGTLEHEGDLMRLQ